MKIKNGPDPGLLGEEVGNLFVNELKQWMLAKSK
jgi:hypothetical protein